MGRVFGVLDVDEKCEQEEAKTKKKILDRFFLDLLQAPSTEPC